MNANRAIHLAIIPDGNRRWAKTKGLPEWKGHEKARDNVRGIIEWCRKDPRVGILTLWSFSTENWKRDPGFVKKLMQMLEKSLRDEWKNFKENGIRFLTSGRRDRLPQSLRTVIEEATEQTKDCKDFILHIALDYGGKDEVVRAFEKLVFKGAAIPGRVTEETIQSHLDQPSLPDIDLIIRTSGEMRTSNFFLWQSVYSEWIFEPKYFPDFGPEDVNEAIREFERRKRRFGS